jgi:protoheme IX farnesyltransferase
MAVLVAGGALLLAPQHMAFVPALLSLVGIALSVMGAGALNMFIERDVDGLMARTKNRPLPGRRLDPMVALVVGGVLSVVSVPFLVVTANVLTAGLTAFSLFLYVLVYTPMKRTSPWSLVVGSIPGAMPALMGYTAATGSIDAVGLALFGIVFFWQLPHFIAISVYRELEYTAAGHKVYPAVWGLPWSKALIVGTSVPLVAVSLALWPLGVAGTVYATVAGLLGVWFLALCIKGFTLDDRKADNAWARRVFIGSLVYQTALFGALAVDVVITRMVH